MLIDIPKKGHVFECTCPTSLSDGDESVKKDMRVLLYGNQLCNRITKPVTNSSGKVRGVRKENKSRDDSNIIGRLSLRL